MNLEKNLAIPLLSMKIIKLFLIVSQFVTSTTTSDENKMFETA
ncbi:hypothetical protein POVCU2_0077330, partial [Plasmodium ovale curtisi]